MKDSIETQRLPKQYIQFHRMQLTEEEKGSLLKSGVWLHVDLDFVT